MAVKTKSPKRRKLDPQTKARIIKISGLLLAVFAVISLIGCISYLFHWRSDQSLLADPSMMDTAVHPTNAGGKVGSKWGHFLVGNCLGLGIFVLLGFLLLLSWRMLSRTVGEKVYRKILIVLSGTFLLSSILAWLGGLSSADTAFGGGLGGGMGHAVSLWLCNLFGKVGAILIILFFVVLWLVFASRRFSEWLSCAFEHKHEIPVPSDGEQVADDITEDEEPAPGPVEDEDAYDDVAAEVVEEYPETVPDTVPASAVVDIPAEDTPAEEIPVEERGVVEQDPSLTIIEDDSLAAPVTKELERYDNRAELEKFKFPPLSILADYKDKIFKVSEEEVEENNSTIRRTLQSYHIQVNSVEAVVGPTVTLYKVKLAEGMRSNSVKTLEKDIGIALGTKSVRVDLLDDAVGIEVPNKTASMVPLKSMFDDDSFRNTKAELPIAIGYTITQKVKIFDLAKAPHILVAGATRQGKSVGLNVLVASLLYSKHPSELKFVFIDPKMVEFTAYKHLLKHYLALAPAAASEEEEMDTAIVKDHKKAHEILQCLVQEMEERYELLSRASVTNLKDYNEKFRERKLLPTDGHRFMPYIVVVIDEYADLIMSAGAGADARNMARGVSTAIVRLAQKGRAAGIHVIIATQRPTVDVITGTIKANFPTRIAFRVIARIDSQTILDQPGAEKLIGNGDMLYYEGIDMERVQCAYVDMKEITAITEFIGSQTGYKQHYNTPYYLPEVPSESGSDGGEGGGGPVDINKLDANFEDAARLVVLSQRGSTSDIQRRLGMGYARAGKVMDQLEAAGIVGPQEGSKPRQVMVADLSELEPILNAFLNK